MLGDLVRPIPGRGVLRSGCEAYDFAVVVQVEPFACVSTAGDMLWACTLSRKDFSPVFRQVPAETIRLMGRLFYGLTNRKIKRARCKVRRAYRLRAGREHQ